MKTFLLFLICLLLFYTLILPQIMKDFFFFHFHFFHMANWVVFISEPFKRLFIFDSKIISLLLAHRLFLAYILACRLYLCSHRCIASIQMFLIFMIHNLQLGLLLLISILNKHAICICVFKCLFSACMSSLSLGGAITMQGYSVQWLGKETP